MAGHNKWSKIKHRKGAVDAKRSKVWTKILREITVAAKLGGTDTGSNSRLRKALEEAKANNITKDTLQRALSKASGDQQADSFEELVYEGYGPSGVAVLVECLTDNRNRTFSEVRTAFNKNGGNLGAEGSVQFGFKKKGQIVLEKESNVSKNLSENTLIEVGLDAGLEEVQEDVEHFMLTSEADALFNLKDTLEVAGFIVASATLVMLPDNQISLSGEKAKILLKLIDSLEDLDDVQHVWSNEDISDEEIEKYMN